MTLDEAIKHCEEVAQEQDMKADFETDNQTYIMSEMERKRCRECADEHWQLAEWLKELKRADTLLKATYNLLNKQHLNYCVLNLLAETVYYDGAECDGNCLMEDIDAWMYEMGIYYDTTRD